MKMRKSTYYTFSVHVAWKEIRQLSDSACSKGTTGNIKWTRFQLEAMPPTALPPRPNLYHRLLVWYQRSYGKEEIRVIETSTCLAVGNGSNYASLVYRVKVALSGYGDLESNEPKTMNIIVKTALPGNYAFDTLSACNVYTKEIEFYERIAPQINAKYRQLKELQQLLPSTYGVCSAKRAILLEDLSALGYQLLSTVRRGFNLIETKFILRKVAAFHAINAVLQQEHPDIFRHFSDGLVPRDTDVLTTFFLTQLDAVVERIAAWPDFTHYADKLRRLRGQVMERARLAFEASPHHFNTLIHGDLWANNLMVRWASGEEPSVTDSETAPDNVILLDFQFSCWTSPAIDLHYFLNTSACETLRFNHIDALIKFYHGHLAAFLQQLRYRKHIPAIDEFRTQFKEKSFYGFVASCLNQPLMMNEETENADFEALCVGDKRSLDFKRAIYSSARTQANLRRLIPLYDKLGVFD